MLKRIGAAVLLAVGSTQVSAQSNINATVTPLSLDQCGDQKRLLHANADALLNIVDRVAVIEAELEALAADSRSLDQTLAALEEVSRNGPGVACSIVGGATTEADWQDGGVAADGVRQTIYANVDTSSFAFAASGHFVPAYVASLQFPASTVNSVGAYAFGQAQVQGATTTGFKVVIAVDPNLFANPTEPAASYSLLELARDSHWSVSWMANAGRCSGAGQAYAWEQYGTGSLRMRVSTAGAGFTTMPSYVVSLGGPESGGAALTTTLGVMGKQTSEFYVYMDTTTPAADAIAANWHINWIGKEAADGTDFFRNTPHAAGTSAPSGWTNAGGTDGAVSLVVDAAAVAEWFRVYQGFVMVCTLNGRTQEEQSIGWSALSANPDGTYSTTVRPTAPWPLLTATPQPNVAAATAGWRIDWIAVPI